VYFTARAEASGAPLTGARGYVLHFAAGQLPPLTPTGFWSVTMYDAQTRFLVENPINRYAINSADRSLLYNADGSLDIYLQATPPAGRESNWLPAPPGNFYVVLRTYLPTDDVRNGDWQPPALRPAG
jgi:hypothetical protein